ncbi:Ser-Thr-rich glycosyl-phosphatidyl-inositol-anchored membrane family-domain-containing protein [Diplogelasinospora grovesii]|jgi:hypothetical protein|uniref:Ser-Thr-rich glycosyl-phosphatidyl-inositol-anchored membrane family-domain-containing protein n=1 Tax=Diplogelasinospora grovesii TaxID=303347 RepID=A0AAN6NKF2_9PEZI|nr:Ser-Thr-rich glycosyl-phosphatidyl-inositol-anchored membrane family-domain-containing protein [Diplogelasinospora grovesii]
MRFLSLLALAAPLVSAIQFTDPAANATVSKGATYDLTWSTVDTDPSTFSIYLVNFANWPPSYQPLALDVETALGAYEVNVPCNIDNSWGYQFNAINGTNVYVIYAQTPKFYISGGPCTDPAPTSATCAAATVTVTVSKTLSSSLYANSTKPAVTTTVTAPLSKITVGGKCPDTIGWGQSGYSYPVTLTNVPHAPGDHPVTTAPAGAWPSKEAFASTSTIYQTVYKDMSEVDSCSC